MSDSTTSILFSVPRKKSAVSDLICKLTKSEASHCAFMYYDGDFECLMVMEADWYGFGLLPFTRWNERNRVVEAFPLQLDTGLRYVAREYLGVAYDYGGALGVLFVRLGRFLKRKIKNPFHSTKAVICSEVAVVALQKQGFPEAETLDPPATTPGDLLGFLRWRTRS